MTAAYVFFHWLTHTSLGTVMQTNEYLFPTVEALHIMGTVALVAFSSVLSLRLIGIFFREIPVSKIASEFLPWAWLGFGVQVVTGTLLFMSEATLAYDNTIFLVKMTLVLLAGVIALVFQRTAYRRVETWDLANPPFWAKVAGYASIMTWFAVVVAGRYLNSSIANSTAPR